ncbi:hypothetical protein ACFXG4_05085 [Nocardia sp. NPDC059246]|uniref:hypothetical protein n=1 Tax=unclassified Nocardia TaxID=2637762 RepID=UPI00368EADE5
MINEPRHGRHAEIPPGTLTGPGPEFHRAGPELVSSNPFDQPRNRQPFNVDTSALTVNGQPVSLPPHVQPVYVVQVPREQIATAVYRGVLSAFLVLFLIGVGLAILIGVVVAASS